MERKVIIIKTIWSEVDSILGLEFDPEIYDEADLYEESDMLGYDIFCDDGGVDRIVSDLFPDVEAYTDKMYDEAYNIESDYWSSELVDYDEQLHGKWENLEIITLD